MSESLYYKMEGKMDLMTHSSVNMKLFRKKSQAIIISIKMK